MIYVGLALIYQAWGDYTVMAAGVCMVIIGIGSVIFHMQQSKLGQVLDEFFMLVMCLFLALGSCGTHWINSGKNERPAKVGACFVFTVGYFAYFVLDNHAIFFLIFTSSIIYCGVVNLTSFPEYQQEYWMLRIGTTALTVGLCPFWLIERLCPVEENFAKPI